MDDKVPTGAVSLGDGRDTWNWISSNPAPASGSLAHLSANNAGLHEHFFNYASAGLPVATGEVLFAYVYLDPANPPSEIMLSWNADNWEHRAYWGANSINYGTNGIPSRASMGALPATGQWVRLEIPASKVGLEGRTVTGMGFSLFGGQATWDKIGKATATTTTPNNTSGSTSSSGDVAWVEDKVPTGATSLTDGKDAWNWVSANPAPYSGQYSHQSNLVAGLHEHYFNYATDTLPVATGDTLYAYIYIDPSNIPSEIMLSWNADNWEHRAYWGTNTIGYGTDGTASRQYIGTIPTAGQWVRLEVPASKVGLEGKTVNGMGYSLVNGRASWDKAGKAVAGSTNTNTGGTSGSDTTASPSSSASDTIWSDDSIPAGASALTDGKDTWKWISSNPAPVSGATAHESSANTGLHEHFFNYASKTLPVAAGDYLFAYVYLDPANPPKEIMLSWSADNWEHRAYWGANSINYGADNSNSRRYMGALPATGQWVRLEIPASKVGLEGATLNGMGFSAYDGRVVWDKTGKSPVPASSSTNTGSNGSGSTGTGSTGGTNTTTPTTTTVDTIWVEDAVPNGATPMTDGKDTWKWVTSPAPASGSSSHESAANSGLHEHFFNYAASTMAVATGDVLFTYVYIDPANPPTEVMVSWNADSWEHRAYWGANSINYGTDSTDSRRSVGALPATGQWVRLEVPASKVGLEGKTVSGMGFSAQGGHVYWDKSGKGVVTQSSSNSGSNTGGTGGSGTGTGGGSTPTTPVDTTPTTPVVTTPSTPSTDIPTGSAGGGTGVVDNSATRVDLSALAKGDNVDYTGLQLPKAGDNLLRVLAPNVLELKMIDGKSSAAAQFTAWSFLNPSGTYSAPSASKFSVTVNGAKVNVNTVGFKRRVLYAPLQPYDLRTENSLYLQLGSNVPDTAVVVVTNPDGSLWKSSVTFAATADTWRYSPAIHVNQEGYVTDMPKKAMVGYWMGDMGEMQVPYTAFSLVDARTGNVVYKGTLTSRLDSGYNTTPSPYQKVMQADFSAFKTPGEYQLQVAGLGASLPFLINDGIAMGFARTYALGLFHQRCGFDETLPTTRFTHAACHTAASQVPSPQSDSQFDFTWKTIASYGSVQGSDNPTQTAPRLTSEASQLYPFVRKGTVDTRGGHHDAGDYSKYTINSAELVHYLMFTADSIPGVADMDNLGIPESGDGISDVMQEAKYEADYLSKLQDTDGGFYFLVYPKNREYESGTLPENGDPQVVWPKNTSVTAAAVAALAECASSPLFKKAYPTEAAKYLAQAKLGWTFLSNAIAKYGKAGAYQKLTFYSDHYTHDDELAWAACEMYLATGDAQYQQKLFEWFPDPSDSNTFRWGWWRMSECWGNAIRSYAFAARTGRLPASSLNSAYLAKCEAQVVAAGDDALDWGKKNAYGTPFPLATKAVRGAGWYFSLDQASDMAVAYQISPKADYIDGLLSAMNYEGGTNPINITYLTGLGAKRQREIVNQYANNDRRVLPPDGIPLGNIQASFDYLQNYGTSLSALTYPSDDAGNNPYPFYDRWSDAFNVTTEFISVNQARSILATTFLASKTPAATGAWKTMAANITVPSTIAALNTPVTLSVNVSGKDLTNARIVWEARDQEPAFGSTYTISPKNNGAQWVEVEVEWPDGRRAFGASTFNANSPVVTWVEDSVPLGGAPGADGGDGWNWVSSPVKSGALAHQSNTASGIHEHWFTGAGATMDVSTGDTLFAWVYLDPASPPKEVMLMWNDGSGWEHRAFWGADSVSYGTTGTAGRYRVGDLPATGQWVKLSVPAKAVGLEGKTVTGMGFTLFDGKATWDAAGRASAGN